MTDKLKITDMLLKYLKVYEWEGDQRQFAYRRALSSINEFISSDDSKDDIISLIESGIYGIGPAISKKIIDLIKGVKPHKYDEIIDRYYKYYSGEKEVNPHKHYMHRSTAYELISYLRYKLEECGVDYYICGSYRRESEVVGDLDILIRGKSSLSYYDLDIVNTILYNINNDGVDAKVEFLAEGPQKTKVEYSSDIGTIEIDFRYVDYDKLGSMLLHFTGPRDFNIKMRRIALSKGYKLNEYGLTDSNNTLQTFHDEMGIFEALGIRYIEPKDRR